MLIKDRWIRLMDNALVDKTCESTWFLFELNKSQLKKSYLINPKTG